MAINNNIATTVRIFFSERDNMAVGFGGRIQKAELSYDFF